jgi:hypothetical protein
MSGSPSRLATEPGVLRLRGPRWVVALLTLGIALTGCANQPLPSIPVQSPVDTAYSWFKAINDHDQSLVLAHIATGERNEPNLDMSGLTFSDVECHLESESSATAQVHCTFSVQYPPNSDPGEGVGTDWVIQVECQPPGPWLIENYG